MRIARQVAPYAGAWIEITFLPFLNASPAVAPYAGAWIEIKFRFFNNVVFSCRPLCGGVD